MVAEGAAVVVAAADDAGAGAGADAPAAAVAPAAQSRRRFPRGALTPTRWPCQAPLQHWHHFPGRASGALETCTCAPHY